MNMAKTVNAKVPAAKKSAPAKKETVAASKKTTPIKKVEAVKKVVAPKTATVKKIAEKKTVAPAKKVVEKKATPAVEKKEETKKIPSARESVLVKSKTEKKNNAKENEVKPTAEMTVRKKIVELPQKINPVKKKSKDTQSQILTKKNNEKVLLEKSSEKPSEKKPNKKKSKKVAVRYSDADLEEFREVIKRNKEEQLEELSMLEERIVDFNNRELADESTYSMHMGEQGSEAVEKEKTYAMIQRIHEHLKKLNDALKRIDDKTYGICRECNCLIAKERLLAVPITTLSASYKIHQKCPEDGIDRIEKR